MVAVAGIGIIICTKRLSKSTMQLIFDFFIALGVSTMLASALLHFLPEVLGIDTEEGYMAAVGKLSVVIAVIYIFWLFEQVTHMLGHEHSHGEFEEDNEAKAQACGSESVLKFSGVTKISNIKLFENGVEIFLIKSFALHFLYLKVSIF